MEDEEIIEKEEMTIENIIGVLESFRLDSLTIEQKHKFIETFYRITIDELELHQNKKNLAKTIQIRWLQTQTCEECHGFGCRTCRGTGKKSVYR